MAHVICFPLQVIYNTCPIGSNLKFSGTRLFLVMLELGLPKSKLLKKLLKNILYSDGYCRKEVILNITKAPSKPLTLCSSLQFP